jgi:hypothetical protein
MRVDFGSVDGLAAMVSVHLLGGHACVES